MSRQVRVETRSRHQNDLKRVMHSTEKVRKWEKKWVRIEETSLQIFKWMPITKNEEQHKQQLQQQISAPVSTDTLITTSQEASYSHESDSKRNQENIQSQSTRDEKSHGGAMPISATLSATTSTKMNGSGDARKMSEPSLGAAMNSLSPSTLHSINPNKRLHEGSDEANESINSPNSKRIKTIAETLTTTGTTQLVDSRSTLVSMHGADPVSSPAPQTIPQPQLSHPSRNAMNETSHHIQLAAETSPRTQQHVQPSTTATPATNDEVAAKLTTPNGSVDIEMMDAEESSGHIELPEQQHQQQQPTTQPLSVVSDMTDTLMEDFSSIVRNVTEQIVIKVSDCYGGDN